LRINKLKINSGKGALFESRILLTRELGKGDSAVEIGTAENAHILLY